MSMLKEQKVWMTIRSFEKAGHRPVPKEWVIKELENKYTRAETTRILDSLLIQHWTAYGEAIEKEKVVEGVETEAHGDSYFPWRYFWPKLVDAIGLGKILGIIVTILAFVPNGIAWKILNFLIDKLS